MYVSTVCAYVCTVCAYVKFQETTLKDPTDNLQTIWYLNQCCTIFGPVQNPILKVVSEKCWSGYEHCFDIINLLSKNIQFQGMQNSSFFPFSFFCFPNLRDVC